MYFRVNFSLYDANFESTMVATSLFCALFWNCTEGF